MRKRNNIPLLLVASEEIETMSVRKWKWGGRGGKMDVIEESQQQYAERIGRLFLRASHGWSPLSFSYNQMG